MTESQIFNIVLVDDDEIQNLVNRKIIELEYPDMNIVAFSEAETALNYVQKQMPDLIFLDINMPRMNGWDFLDQYCALEVRSPVYVLTSSINNMDKNKSKSYDAVRGFLSKPLKTGMVRDIIESLSRD